MDAEAEQLRLEQEAAAEEARLAKLEENKAICIDAAAKLDSALAVVGQELRRLLAAAPPGLRHVAGGSLFKAALFRETGDMLSREHLAKWGGHPHKFFRSSTFTDYVASEAYRLARPEPVTA